MEPTHIDLTNRETLISSAILFVTGAIVRYFEKRKMKRRFQKEKLKETWDNPDVK